MEHSDAGTLHPMMAYNPFITLRGVKRQLRQWQEEHVFAYAEALTAVPEFFRWHRERRA
jgi:hypothetical protein